MHSYSILLINGFDFKENERGLEKHVCAMANTITGVLCLGIKDPTSNSPSTVFRKDGFRIGTEDERLNSIYNNVAKVDPIPRVTHRFLKDPDKKQFYVILKVVPGRIEEHAPNLTSFNVTHIGECTSFIYGSLAERCASHLEQFHKEL